MPGRSGGWTMPDGMPRMPCAHAPTPSGRHGRGSAVVGSRRRTQRSRLLRRRLGAGPSAAVSRASGTGARLHGWHGRECRPERAVACVDP